MILRAYKVQLDVIKLNWPSLAILQLPNGNYKSYEINRRE